MGPIQGLVAILVVTALACWAFGRGSVGQKLLWMALLLPTAGATYVGILYFAALNSCTNSC